MKLVSLTLVVLLCLAMAAKAQVPTPTQSKADCVLGVTLSGTTVGRGLQMVPNTANVDNAISGLAKVYSYLSQEKKDKIKSCGISLTGPLSRCEAANGQGNCESDAMYVQKKCPEGLTRIGCCTCAKACPTGFDDKGLFCVKPAAIKSAQYTTQSECESLSKTSCEQWTLDFWVSKCPAGFARVGADQCIALCPEGWVDSGRTCLKPNSVNLSAPFVWTSADN